MDFHFVIRNGIAGGVFLAALMAGVWVADPADVDRLVNAIQPLQATVVALIAAGTPIIGICLQSILLLGRYIRHDAFTDEARRVVADRFRAAIKVDEGWSGQYRRLLKREFDDRLFVSLYHRKAPQHLIEWARRRRSYDYLGGTSVLGALLGVAFGYAGALFYHPGFAPTPVARLGGVAVLLIAWCWAATFLAGRMRRDADAMELAWAIFELTPDLEARIENSRTGPREIEP